MALRHRIGRLETQSRVFPRPSRCTECGHAAGDGVDGVRILPPDVVRSLDDLVGPAAEAASDRCGRCRRRLVYRMPSPEWTASEPNRRPGIALRATDMVS